MKERLIFTISLLFILISTTTAQNTFLDFREVSRRPNDKIWNVDSLKISFTQCIAIYEGLNKSSIYNNTDLIRLLKGKHNKILVIIYHF
ncbi:MAG TPA: hypothetical protein DIT04_09520 [Dysgonomonas sp.]|nr:hypothetical protein [Dysgonomonas sp.]